MKESKLPTAEQIYDKCRLEGLTYDITSNQNPNYHLPFYQAIFRIMESHTQAHTEGLREELKALRSVLKGYSETVGKDLSFLREILDRFRKSERDPTQREYAEQMITDWITELETK